VLSWTGFPPMRDRGLQRGADHPVLAATGQRPRPAWLYSSPQPTTGSRLRMLPNSTCERGLTPGFRYCYSRACPCVRLAGSGGFDVRDEAGYAGAFEEVLEFTKGGDRIGKPKRPVAELLIAGSSPAHNGFPRGWISDTESGY
jgi:hypothetical protein